MNLYYQQWRHFGKISLKSIRPYSLVLFTLTGQAVLEPCLSTIKSTMLLLKLSQWTSLQQFGLWCRLDFSHVLCLAKTLHVR